MEIDGILTSFYRDGAENKRLVSKHGAIEFITTTKYINKYLNEGDKILEIGSGTGRYSLYYAHKDYEVDAIELVEENLKVLKDNILPTDNIRAIQGNALDLSMYPNETFDITLLLGPMYHLFTREEKIKCLSEALRVTKKGGVVFVAYCQFDASMIQTGFIRNMYDFLVENNLLDNETILPISNPNGIFELYRKEQIDELNLNFDIDRLHYVGTDMFTHYFSENIDRMDEILYQKYIRYTLNICENQNLVGLSNHTLDILRKIN